MLRLGFLLLGSLSVLAGCHGKDTTARSQSDDDADKSRLQTIGDVAEFQTSGAIPISGVGLVVNLDGTGGGTPPGEYRNMMEQYLKKCKIDNPKEWLDSRDNALVLVNAEIPVGSRRGERINIEITLPPGSKARSLRGGYLLETPLTSYSTQGQVRAYLEQNTDIKPQSLGDGLLKGHILADAEGPLQVALKDKENVRAAKERIDGPASERGLPETAIKRAWIWKGGRTKKDQPLYVVMNPDQQRYRKAEIVTSRINEVFQGPQSLDKIARQRNADTIEINVPPQYRSNIGHFLRVVRLIPELRAEENSDYQRKLEEQLKQPETTLSAALRLEALGRGSVPALRSTMRNSEYPLVRFAAAEVLAYLGEPICASELGKIAQSHPSMQAFCLSALGSLDEAASVYALQDLLASDCPEVRYGAFRALRDVDRDSDAARGFRMNKSFWLHVLGSESKPMIHLLSTGRAEVVLFGKSPQLVAPFSLRAGPDIIITARRGDTACTISRFSTHKSERHAQCSYAVADVVKAVADMGALYQDVADLLIQANETKCLNCELAIDALPKAVPVQKLAENALVDKMMENEKDLLKSAVEEQADPTRVFDRSARR
jgi:flagellar basal body P-ring protein FlgI